MLDSSTVETTGKGFCAAADRLRHKTRRIFEYLANSFIDLRSRLSWQRFRTLMLARINALHGRAKTGVNERTHFVDVRFFRDQWRRHCEPCWIHAQDKAVFQCRPLELFAQFRERFHGIGV